MATKLKDTDYGIGYASNEFADTTASPERVRDLARLVAHPDGEYRYTRPPADDDEWNPPCHYLRSLDPVLAPQLRCADTWDQACAMVEMAACQISQTGYVPGGKRRATVDEMEWAHRTFAASRAAQSQRRVPGTCRGCNSTPCRCWA